MAAFSGRWLDECHYTIAVGPMYAIALMEAAMRTHTERIAGNIMWTELKCDGKTKIVGFQFVVCSVRLTSRFFPAFAEPEPEKWNTQKTPNIHV